MDWKSRIRAVCVVDGSTLDEEVVEELSQHALAAYEAARADGRSHEEARHDADTLIAGWQRDASALRRRPRRTTLVVPPSDRATFLAGVVQDAHHGLRILRRKPGFTAVAILTVALGIGATTLLFSVANGVLLKPLPWPDPDRITRVTETRKGQPGRLRGTVSNGAYLAWSDQPSTIEALGGYSVVAASMTVARGNVEPTRIQVGRLTASMFRVLRAQPLRGRVFTDTETLAGGVGPNPDPGVVIVSYGLWQDWYGGRDEAVGTTVRMDGLPVTIVGIMPREFASPDREARAWLPMPIGAVKDSKVIRLMIFGALARLKPGVTAAQAAAEATTRARNAPDAGFAAVAMFGSNEPPAISIVPAVEAMTAEVRPAILLLLVAVALLLATATANTASLQLAHATTRRREMAVRAAMGAGRRRIVRQLIVESALIGGSGGVAGLLLVTALHRALPTLLPADFPRVADIGIDGRVLAFVLVVSLATSLLCGLLPALQVSRVELVDVLAEDGPTSAAGVSQSRSARLRTIVMAGQVAVAGVLLVGAALLGRSFLAMMRADRGYDPNHVLTARLDLPRAYDGPRRAAFADALLDRMRGVPGVLHAAAGNALPFVSLGGNFGFAMPSPTDPGIKVQVQTMTRIVSPDYFQTLRLRLLEGRPLLDADTEASRPVIVVNRSFAQRYLGRSPLGARVPLSFGEGRPDCDVVGVVDDMRQGDMTDPPAAEVFSSYRQMPNRLTNGPLIVIVRTDGDPVTQVPALRAAIREQDSGLVADSIMTMDERLATSLAKPRLYATVLGGFALSAVGIACVGLYGVLSYGVAQRTREIGVRTALGARPVDVMLLVLRQGITIAVVGVVAGLSAGLAAGKLLSSFLYGVDTHDGVSFAGAAVIVVAVSAVACIVPARRAARVDPLKALRTS